MSLFGEDEVCKRMIGVVVAFIVICMSQHHPVCAGNLFATQDSLRTEYSVKLEYSMKPEYSTMTNYSLKPEELHAKSAVLIDGETGRILFEKNSHEKRSNASTTKILTCILAIENGNMGDVVEISHKAASMPKVNMKTKAGEKYRLKDLLYAMMLESYNDVAVAVAERLSGNVENFAKMMNEKAIQIGAYNSNFVTPNGLDSDNHYSTAYDMALIGAYAVKNEIFLEITNTKSYSFNELTGKRNITVYNRDRFLEVDKNAVGIKTGFTGKAGYCFVGAINNEGHKMVSCVLGSRWPPNKRYKWDDTEKIMGLAKTYKYKHIQLPLHDRIKVSRGVRDYINVAVNDEYLLALKNDDEVCAKRIIFDYNVAPISKDQCVGLYYIIVNGEVEKVYELKAKEKVDRFDLKYCMKKIIEILFLTNHVFANG